MINTGGIAVRKIVLSGILLVLLSLWGCNKKSVPENPESNSPTINAITEDPKEEKADSRVEQPPELPVAVCTANMLNVRDVPWLEGNTIGALVKDQQVTPLEQSYWQETIAGLTAPWVKIETEELKGWVFAAYIDITGELPVSTMKKPRSEEELLLQPIHLLPDLSQFPDVSIPVTGFEEPPYIETEETPSLQLGISFYEEFYLVTDQLPKKQVILTGRDPYGEEHQWIYKMGSSINLIESGSYYPPSDRKDPVPALPFALISSLPAGIWTFDVKVDQFEQPVIVKELEIPSIPVTLSTKPEISATKHFTYRQIRLNQKDSLYVWLNLPEKDWGYFVVYKVEEAAGMVNFKPYKAQRVQLDEKGMASGIIEIDETWEAGGYRTIFGQNIDGPMVMRSKFNVRP